MFEFAYFPFLSLLGVWVFVCLFVLVGWFFLRTFWNNTASLSHTDFTVHVYMQVKVFLFSNKLYSGQLGTHMYIRKIFARMHQDYSDSDNYSDMIIQLIHEQKKLFLGSISMYNVCIVVEVINFVEM